MHESEKQAEIRRVVEALRARGYIICLSQRLESPKAPDNWLRSTDGIIEHLTDPCWEYPLEKHVVREKQIDRGEAEIV